MDDMYEADFLGVTGVEKIEAREREKQGGRLNAALARVRELEAEVVRLARYDAWLASIHQTTVLEVLPGNQGDELIELDRLRNEAAGRGGDGGAV